MLEFIRTHRRLMQFLLLLLIVPSFAFVGLESYMGMGDGQNAVAKVGKDTITQPEWDAAQREQMDRFRQMFGEQFDPKMFDTPEAKQEILNNLIAQRVLAAEAARNNLTVSDQALQQTIVGIPGLAGADGKFDVEQYKRLLAVQGMTPAMYEARLRRDLALQQVNASVQGTAFAPKSVTTRLSELADQERTVQELLFRAADYKAQAKVTDEMLASYYEKSGTAFETPELVNAEYVVLSSDKLSAQVTASDEEVEAHYKQNISRFTEPEQRRASHILVAVGKGAPAADKAAAKAKAEKLLAEVRKTPTDFARIAKASSDDKSSAELGGDLDFIGGGKTIDAIEKAAAKMKQGEISDLVESDFGFHIIQLTALKPPAVTPLEKVKTVVAEEIKSAKAAKLYSESATLFNDTAYEQADSLKPVADKLKLKIEKVERLKRQPDPATPAGAPYNNAKLLSLLFADDAVKNKRNTEAVEVAPNVLVVARVVNYTPKSKRPFAEVKEVVRERVTQIEASTLAKKAGEAKLATLKQKDDATGFSAPQTISRAKSQGLDQNAFAEVMRADTSKLPTYVGVELPQQGYSIVRVVKVGQPATVDAAKRQGEQQQIAAAVAQQEMLAYLEELKAKAKVKIIAAPAAKTE